MQTSIEWLIERLNTINPTQIEYHQAIKQAKEMHKNEIIDAWVAEDNILQRLAAEKYYNQTFTHE
jgi:hypothetical protein